MSELESNGSLEDFYSQFINCIHENDFIKMNEILNQVKNQEIRFLENYDKRKKEGVYYTDWTIADFIVTKVVIHFLNKKLRERTKDQEVLEELDDLKRLNQASKDSIFNLLLKTSACDPVCGSGVFLLSYAKIVLKILNHVKESLKTQDIKHKILKQLIGFDINEQAVHLCHIKLFFWAHCIEEDERKSSNNARVLISLIQSNITVKNSLIELSNETFSSDIIISNPPYGNILSKEEKKILKAEGIFYNEIYCAFLLKAIEWSNDTIGFLIPKSFLLRQGYVEFRKLFLEKVNILSIHDIGSKLFKTATNEVQIIIYEKKDGKSENLRIYDYPNSFITQYDDQKVDSLRICFNLQCPQCSRTKKIYAYTFKEKCPFCKKRTMSANRIRIKPNKAILQIIDKVERIGDLNYLNVKDFPKMIRGEEDKGLKEVLAHLRKNIEGDCYFINAKSDLKYYFLRLNENKSFAIEEINEKILKGNNYEYYTEPKLLIKHNNIIPEAVYSKEWVCFTSSIYSLLYDNPEELKFICALLNSALIQFYCIYGINNQKDTTINLNQYMIRHLPLIRTNVNIKGEISTKVDEIINDLKQNEGIITENVKLLLMEIDDLIFNLYSLTEQERQLIISDLRSQIPNFQRIY